MNLNIRTAIVTGSTKGIGRGIAEALLREGINVCVSARHETEVTRAVEELSEEGAGRVTGTTCDVRDYEHVKSLFAHAVAEFGSRVRVLTDVINFSLNHGVSPPKRRKTITFVSEDESSTFKV